MSFISPPAKYSLPQLEHKLALYVSGDREMFAKPFDISTVALISEEQARAEALKQKKEQVTEDVKQDTKRHTKTPSIAQRDNALQQELQAQQHQAALASIPEFQSYGSLLNSSLQINLSDEDAEYVVNAVKHVFKDHLVVQYNVTNTLSGTVLENVIMDVQGDFEEEFIIPIDSLAHEATGTIYVSFVRPQEPVATRFENALKFVSKEVGEDDGFDDTYNLEDLVISAGDYINPSYIGNFQHQWDELSNEQVRTFQISSASSIAETITGLTKLLSLAPVESSDVPASEASHTLKLFGRAIGGEKVAAQIRMVYSSRSGVTLKVTARSEQEDIANLVVDSVEDM
jgi:coatomer protein complex subunit gamma